MAVKQVDIEGLAEIGSITSSTAGTTTNGVKVNWDNAKVTRHEVAVTLQNIADAILDDNQVTF